MNDDAKEAALGLLGLSPNNFRTPDLLPSHSFSNPTIPAKRKQITLELEELASATVEAAASSSRNGTNVDNSIRCICGSTFDDGFSIACDVCERWCHAACFDIVEGGVPEEWRCWECNPRPVDCERAARLQRERMRMILEAQQLLQQQKVELDKGKRKGSPGVEKKHKRTSAAAIEGGKRRRRSSVAHASPHVLTTTVVAENEDEHIDIDEPWSQSYVHITEDIISSDETRQKLRLHAHEWRGVTAFTSSPLLRPLSAIASPIRHPRHLPLPSTTVRPVDPHAASHRALSTTSSLDIRPPVYGLHTTTPVPTHSLITPYTSTLIPSSAYVSDSLNSYAHLGLPKPFVHLMGSPLHLALDSRMAGDDSRFVRNGCKPNAVLRPMLCDHFGESCQDTLRFGIFSLRDLKENEEVVLGWEWDDGNVVHNLPALIETPHIFPASFLSDNQHYRPEEIQHLRHQFANILHSLSSTFTTCACGSRSKDCAFTLMSAVVDGSLPDHQPDISSPASSSTSPLSRVNTDVDFGPLIGQKRGFRTRERVPWSGGMGGLEVCDEEGPIDGTLPRLVVSPPYSASDKRRRTGVEKGKGKALHSSVDILSDGDDIMRGWTKMTPKDSLKSLPDQVYASSTSCSSPISVQDLRPPDPPDEGMDVDQGSNMSHVPNNTFKPEAVEEKMPPKMRKRWIHRALDELREKTSGDSSPDEVMGLGIRLDSVDLPPKDDPISNMPPPPIPPADSMNLESLVPSSSQSQSQHRPSTSPSTSFARLSLLSPLVTVPSQGERLQQQLPNQSDRDSSPLRSWNPLLRVQSGNLSRDTANSSPPSLLTDDFAPSPPPVIVAGSRSPAVDVPSPSPGPTDQEHFPPQRVEHSIVSPVISPAATVPPSETPLPVLALPVPRTSPPPVTAEYLVGVDHVSYSNRIVHEKRLLPLVTVDSEASTPATYPIPLNSSAPNSLASTPAVPLQALPPPSMLGDDVGDEVPAVSPQSVPELTLDDCQSQNPSTVVINRESQLALDPPKSPPPLVPEASHHTHEREDDTPISELPVSVHHLSPPPAPRVKMSLKDFALRKKKQREEEQQLKKNQPKSSLVDMVVTDPEEVKMMVVGDDIEVGVGGEGDETNNKVEGHESGEIGQVAKEQSQDLASGPLTSTQRASDHPNHLHYEPNSSMATTLTGDVEKENLKPGHTTSKFVLRAVEDTILRSPATEVPCPVLEEDAVSLGESSEDEPQPLSSAPPDFEKHQPYISAVRPSHHGSRSLSPYSLPSRPHPPPPLSRLATLPPRPRTLLLPPKPRTSVLPGTLYPPKQEHLEPAVPMVPVRHNGSTSDVSNHPPKPLLLNPRSFPLPRPVPRTVPAASTTRFSSPRGYSHEDGEIESSPPPAQKTVYIPTGPRALSGFASRPEHVSALSSHAISLPHPPISVSGASSIVHGRSSPVIRRAPYPPAPSAGHSGVAPPTAPRALRVSMAAQRKDRDERGGGR